MAGTLRNLRARARKAANRQGPAGPPPTGGGNGARPSAPPAAPPPAAPPPVAVPAQATPAPPGVPPAGSAWPGASPAVAPRPPAPRQETRPSPPPTTAPAAPAGGSPPRRTTTDDSRPATQGQLKSLRRWLLVAAAWATAATVIAVLAFLAANTDEEQRLAENNAQLRQIQSNIAKRVATVRQELGGLRQENSVQTLQGRVARLGRSTLRNDKSADRQLRQLSTRLSEVEQQLKFIQASQKSGAGGAGTTTTP